MTKKIRGSMVGKDIKAETMVLMEKRAALEAEMNSIIDRLWQPGGPGLTGNLVDAEGFPRADIDIPVVRAERRRLSELRNDHKEITDKIEANIQVLHSARLSTTSRDPGNDGGLNSQNMAAGNGSLYVTLHNFLSESSSSMDVDVIDRMPFAMVDEITNTSPAAEDGLQLGDQIVKFGSVEAGENLQERLAVEAYSNQGRGVSVVVMRQGSLINLTVTPRIWEGRGLLGCHLRLL